MNSEYKSEIEDLEKFSYSKANNTFDSLPYTLAKTEDYDGFLKRRNLAKKTFFKRIVNVTLKISAILFISFMVYLFIQNKYIPQKAQENKMVEYIVNPGVKGKVTLPDGSDVWLNSKSTLKCPTIFSSNERKVILNGEAYFKVKSNKDCPMYIKTSQGVTIRVLGTEFNIKAYDDDSSVKLSLFNGEVELIKQHGEITKCIDVFKHEEIMVFNDSSISDSDSKRVMSHIEMENVSAWKNGYLVFNDTPIVDVIKMLERWYGVTFNPVNPMIGGFRFTARFKTESLTQVLDLLSISSNINYRIKENKVSLF